MIENKNEFRKGLAIGAGVTLLIFFGTSFASATWRSPTASPPNCPLGSSECGVSLTTGADPQSKRGRLGLSSIFFPDYIITGNVSSPNASVRLEVGGMLRLSEDSSPRNRCGTVNSSGDGCVSGDPGLSCTASLSGTLRYNRTTRGLEFCNGLGAWQEVSLQ